MFLKVSYEPVFYFKQEPDDTNTVAIHDFFNEQLITQYFQCYVSYIYQNIRIEKVAFFFQCTLYNVRVNNKNYMP